MEAIAILSIVIFLLYEGYRKAMFARKTGYDLDWRTQPPPRFATPFYAKRTAPRTIAGYARRAPNNSTRPVQPAGHRIYEGNRDH